MSVELVMLFNHLILCHPLLLLPLIFPSIRVFSNELALHIRWPKYWSFFYQWKGVEQRGDTIKLNLRRSPSTAELRMDGGGVQEWKQVGKMRHISVGAGNDGGASWACRDLRGDLAKSELARATTRTKAQSPDCPTESSNLDHALPVHRAKGDYW